MNHQLTDAGMQNYAARIDLGILATRKGVTGTPLTTAIRRWGEPIEIFSDERYDGLDMPTKILLLTRMCEQFAEAIDAEDELSPYRFQRVGQIWMAHFTVDDVVKRIPFEHHVGFPYINRLFDAQHRSIKSFDLAGQTDPRKLAIIQEERQRSTIRRHDFAARADYKGALTTLKEQRLAAQDKGDDAEFDRLNDQINDLEKFLLPGKRNGAEPNFATLRRQEEGKKSLEFSIHKTVATAIRRAKQKLRKYDMSELADYLDRTVHPEGKGFDYAYAYRPPAPAPEWIL